MWVSISHWTIILIRGNPKHYKERSESISCLCSVHILHSPHCKLLPNHFLMAIQVSFSIRLVLEEESDIWEAFPSNIVNCCEYWSMTSVLHMFLVYFPETMQQMQVSVGRAVLWWPVALVVIFVVHCSCIACSDRQCSVSCNASQI